MKDKSVLSISLFVLFCIMLNMAGKYLASFYQVPLWLDSMGTVAVACTLGPVCGAIVGATVNVAYGLMDHISFVYAIVNVFIGVIAGIMAKKGYLKTFFRSMSLASVLAIFSVVVSVPLNFIFNSGYTGNAWGDGVINLLIENRFPPMIASVVGEFYIDFIDKMLVVVLFWFIRKINCFVADIRDRKKRDAAKIMVIALVCCGMISGMWADPEPVSAQVSYDNYVRTIYDTDDGLMGGTATCVASTKDGVIWIGAYEGLYRYTGSNIQLVDDIDSVHNANSIFVDAEGRMWVGTNDSGLTICINGVPVNVLDEDSGLPSNSIRAIAESSDGKIYVGTSGAMAVISLSGGLSVIAKIDINFVKSISTDKNGNVVVVNNEGELFLIKDDKIRYSALVEDEHESFSCCCFGADGYVYAGTSHGDVHVMELTDTGFVLRSKMGMGMGNVNSIRYIDADGMYICADNGAWRIPEGGHLHQIDTGVFHDSIDTMTVDYQGNLWFSSSRLGVMYMCESSFVNIFERASIDPAVVNTVTFWNDRFYVGTDNGLHVIGKDYKIKSNSLIKPLTGVRIRCIKALEDGNLWICTSGEGLWCVTPDGQIQTYSVDNGTSGSKFRTCLLTKDGTVYAAGDSGISIIKDGEVTANIGYEEGLSNIRVLSLMVMKDGRILAGTDGGGLAVIDGTRVVKRLKHKEGLSCDIVLRTVEDEDGYFILTGNGLCYMDKDFKIGRIANFPYYNNFDLVERENGDIFVLSSGGIYVTDREKLLAGGELEYYLLDYKMGLPGTITANAWNYVSDDNILYFSSDVGVCCIDLNNYLMENRSYRMMMEYIKVDGEVYNLDDYEKIVIPRGSERVDFTPEIINYSVLDPYVEYYLEGYDNVPSVVRYSELGTVSYTNLKPGDYVFHIAVLDLKQKSIIEEKTYGFSKEMDIQDHWWFRAYTIAGFVLFMMWLSWFVTRMFIQRTIDFQRKEIDHVKAQVNMGNETIMAIARTVDAKDENTSQHSVRVSEYSVLLAQKLGYTPVQCENLRKMALLHDIGKIGIPDRVLKNPGKLTQEEYEIMKSHVTRGAEILKDFTLVDNVTDGVLYHHERYDGNGYMAGLKGENIPLNGRIICIADAFDAMTANRVYRKKLQLSVVIDELKRCAGTQFDPKLVHLMLEMIEDGTIDVHRIYEDSRIVKHEPVEGAGEQGGSETVTDEQDKKESGR